MNALAQNRHNSLPYTARFPDKGSAIEGLVVCNGWYLEPLDLLNDQALDCYQPSPEVFISPPPPPPACLKHYNDGGSKGLKKESPAGV